MKKIVLILFYIINIQLTLFGRRIYNNNNNNNNKVLLNLTDNENISFSYLKQRKLLTTNPEDHRVIDLPGLSDKEKLVHYAGHLLVDESKKGNIFYWLFEKPKNSLQAPLLIWLNGGPGCSSMDGLFLELGPLRLNGMNMDKIKINPDSWHNAANLLFVDQPVGTGLSYTSRDGYANSDEVVNLHFYNFLIQFFTLHDRYTFIKDGHKHTRPFYMSGESHAGHYIPCMSAYIMKKNLEVNNGLFIDIQGIALGNPWTDPYNQYDVSNFAHGLGLISQGQKNKLKQVNDECRATLKSGKYSSRACYSLLDNVVDASSITGSPKVLMYDARKYVSSTRSFPIGHEDVEKYLNRADVRKSIHATSAQHRFTECADPPFNALSHQDGKGVTNELSEILNKGLRVFVYSGQFDIICNHLGVELMLQELTWTGQSGWLKAQPGIWVVNHETLGFVKTFGNLESLLVLNSGHMVPLDLPLASLDMITRFLAKSSFSSGTARLTVSEKKSPECPTLSETRSLNNLSVKNKINIYTNNDVLNINSTINTIQYCSNSNVCFVSISFFLKPTNSMWSQEGIFEDYKSNLESMIVQDINSALQISINNNNFVSNSKDKINHYIRGGHNFYLSASIELLKLNNNKRHLIEEELSNENYLQVNINMSGMKDDVISAISSLITQSNDISSPLKQGLLTSLIKSKIEIFEVKNNGHYFQSAIERIYPILDNNKYSSILNYITTIQNLFICFVLLCISLFIIFYLYRYFIIMKKKKISFSPLKINRSRL